MTWRTNLHLTMGYALLMERADPNTERRELPRVSAEGFQVDLRPQGRLARMQAQAVDFNRYGIAVVTTTALKERKKVYVTLRLGDLQLDSLVGVVHNCCQHEGGFRCGIRFKTHAELQTDRALVESLLTSMEQLASALEPSSA